MYHLETNLIVTIHIVCLARMFNDSLLSFRRFCLQSKTLPADLHIKMCDIAKNAGNNKAKIKFRVPN